MPELLPEVADGLDDPIRREVAIGCSSDSPEDHFHALIARLARFGSEIDAARLDAVAERDAMRGELATALAQSEAYGSALDAAGIPRPAADAPPVRTRRRDALSAADIMRRVAVPETAPPRRGRATFIPAGDGSIAPAEPDSLNLRIAPDREPEERRGFWRRLREAQRHP